MKIEQIMFLLARYIYIVYCAKSSLLSLVMIRCIVPEMYSSLDLHKRYRTGNTAWQGAVFNSYASAKNRLSLPR